MTLTILPPAVIMQTKQLHFTFSARLWIAYPLGSSKSFPSRRTQKINNNNQCQVQNRGVINIDSEGPIYWLHGLFRVGMSSGNRNRTHVVKEENRVITWILPNSLVANGVILLQVFVRMCRYCFLYFLKWPNRRFCEKWV